MWRDSIKFSRQSSQRCSWESSKCLPCKSKTLVYLTRLESTNIILSPSTNFIKGHWTSRGFQHIVSKYDENYRTPPAYWQITFFVIKKTVFSIITLSEKSSPSKQTDMLFQSICQPLIIVQSLKYCEACSITVGFRNSNTLSHYYTGFLRKAFRLLKSHFQIDLFQASLWEVPYLPFY